MKPADIEHVIVEADGGSRGNPGPSAYGAVLKDARTGEVIAEIGEAIGVATNNVAEYRGLIAGLLLAAEHAPNASIEVRMDSKLVVEQMSGTWKVKHPSMRPLAVEAGRLAPTGTTFTWVPRAENAHADRLANEALDGLRDATGPIGSASVTEPAARAGDEPAVEEAAEPEEKPRRGWHPPSDPPTTLILVRHGVTDHTTRKVFSGGLSSANPPLNEEGRAQVRATGEWLSPMRDQIDALVASPVRRTHESAEILGEILGHPVELEEAIAEMEFGSWDGLTFADIQEKFPDELSAWLGDLEYAPGGGESFRTVADRVLLGRNRIVESYAGRTVLVVSHVTPIKTLVADALGAPLEALFRMELSPASVTVISYFAGRGPNGEENMANLRLYNARPTDAPFS
ncbi:bifunctional RNase H/acid phosphatase [Nocardioides pocheonensis]|uniref:bifunctional RNase H/acid phosphatase n=1 Tax=Nocardioides pocheonensis TaxID=661485 RepID=UPI001FEA5E2F|nr:bifunctional RNase H/acid phosphatase [Nocardioides pocheonensis]